MGKYKFQQVLYKDEANSKKILGEPCKNPDKKGSYIKITLDGKIYGFGGFDADDDVLLIDFSERKMGAEFTGIKVRKKILQKLGAKARVDIVTTTYKV